MDYKRLATETITAVRNATRKEDEMYGGEILAQRLDDALKASGVDIESKFGFPTWYGAPDDILVELVSAFVDDPQLTDQLTAENDPGVSRIQSDLYDALQENGHLEESHPDFWEKAMNVL